MKKAILALLVVALLIFSSYFLINFPNRCNETYLSCVETASFAFENLELEGTNFKYSRSTDLILPEELGQQPSTFAGVYIREGDTFVFKNSSMPNNLRHLVVMRGIRVLLTKKGYAVWTQGRRLDPFELLICVNDLPGPVPTDGRPSVVCITDPIHTTADDEEYVNRFNELPGGLRTLLRAHTARRGEDPRREAYRRAIEEFRLNMSREVVDGLVSLMGYDARYHIQAKVLLQRIFVGDRFIDAPKYSDAHSKRLALEVITGSFPYAKDGNALECLLELFLKCASIEQMELYIPEARCRIQYDGIGLKADVEGARDFEEIKAMRNIEIVRTATMRWCKKMIDTH